MRPVGAAVHFQKGTVNLRLVKWLCIGSVPSAFFGVYLLHKMGNTTASINHIEILLGTALLIGAGAMLLRYGLDRISGQQRMGTVTDVLVKPVPTLLIGVIGGLIVGMTSVGAGSLIIVLLMFLYPVLAANQLVGTDLVQAIPLTAAAALGVLVFGHLEIPLTLSIIVGSVPAVFLGSLISSRVSDKILRPTIMFCDLRLRAQIRRDEDPDPRMDPRGGPRRSADRVAHLHQALASALGRSGHGGRSSLERSRTAQRSRQPAGWPEHG